MPRSTTRRDTKLLSQNGDVTWLPHCRISFSSRFEHDLVINDSIENVIICFYYYLKKWFFSKFKFKIIY